MSDNFNSNTKMTCNEPQEQQSQNLDDYPWIEFKEDDENERNSCNKKSDNLSEYVDSDHEESEAEQEETETWLEKYNRELSEAKLFCESDECKQNNEQDRIVYNLRNLKEV